MANRYEAAGGVKSREFSAEEKDERQWFLNYLRGLKEAVENNELTPQADWDTIFVLSGPEYSFSAAETEDKGDASTAFNQTKERLEKGFELVRAVTALRVGKHIDEVTLAEVY